MSRRAASLWVLLFLLLALVGGGTGLLRSDDSRRSGGPVALASSGRVVHIVDGDTVDVRIGDAARRVRYIGVDTPESVKPDTPVQCFAKQGSAFNSRLVAGRRVRLQYGPDRHDRYGRLLAYVYLPGHSRSVNAELVAEGYGRVLAIAPNTAHLRPYLRLERLARERHLGLWGSCDYRPLDF